MVNWKLIKKWVRYGLIDPKDAVAFARNDMAKQDISSLGIEFTIFLLIMALILVPIGLKSILTVNKTAVGIESGSTVETIFDNIVPIVLVVIILAVIYMVKK